MGGWWLVGHWRLPDHYKKLHLRHENADGLPSKFRRKVAPKIWYFMVNSGAVFFLPFLGIYWRTDLGYTTRQIGLLQALRPWVSAVASNTLTPLADIWNIHYIMLLVTYAGTMISRGLITMPWHFGIMLFLALVMESSVSVMSVLVDATVVAGSTKDGTYGRARLWASIGWGALAPVAGVIINKWGIHTSFMVFATIYSLAAIPTALVPAGLLNKKFHAHRNTSEESASSSSGSSKSEVVAAAAATSHSITRTEVENSAPNSVGQLQSQKSGALVDEKVATTTTTTTANNGGVTRRRTTNQNNSEQHVVHVDFRSDRSSAHHVIINIQSPPAAPLTEIQSKPSAVPGSTPKQQQLLPESTGVIAIIQVGNEGKTGQQAGEKGAEAAEAAAAPPVVEEGVWKGLRSLFSDVYVLTFMFLAFLMGVGNGFIGYLFLLLSDLGAKGTLLGLCLTLNCVGEIPFFYYSGDIIKRIGVQHSLNIAMGAYCLRCGCYSLLPLYPSLWIVLPVELLQGITFGLAYSAGTVHCRRIAPKRLRSTVQSIFSGLYTGFGAGVGGLVGGIVYDVRGGQAMFVVATGTLGIGWAAINFTNLVHGMARGVRKVKKVGTNFMIRVSPAWGGGKEEVVQNATAVGNNTPQQLGQQGESV